MFAETKGQMKNLKALLELSNVDLMEKQGTITESERKILRDASSTLNINEEGKSPLSNAAFGRQLKNVVGVLNSASGQDVNILATKGGRSEVIKNATRKQINEFIQNNYSINYLPQ